jgi:hypothetical protein
MKWGQKCCINKRNGDMESIEVNETHKDREWIRVEETVINTVTYRDRVRRI